MLIFTSQTQLTMEKEFSGPKITIQTLGYECTPFESDADMTSQETSISPPPPPHSVVPTPSKALSPILYPQQH